VFNSQPTPKQILDAEIPVAGGLDPSAGWQMWQGPDHEYPVTTLPALEAVQAAKEQSLKGSETLDRALRRAFFAESKTIAMRDVILEVARGCEGLDENELVAALDDGRARARILEQKTEAEEGSVDGSPHVFLADGADVHNPGIEMEWHGDHGKGFPIVNKDDPSIYEDLLQRAAGR
jgi:predicted DsbA family dithiol-disulfide isomerase